MIKLEDTEKNITLEEVLEFEIEFNIKFPEEYKTHILKYNGGYPTDELYFKGYQIDEFIPLKYGDYHMSERLSNLSGFLEDKSIPFSTSNGGIIFLDHNHNVFIKYSDGQLDFISESFSIFLNGLKNEPYDF